MTTSASVAKLRKLATCLLFMTALAICLFCAKYEMRGPPRQMTRRQLRAAKKPPAWAVREIKALFPDDVYKSMGNWWGNILSNYGLSRFPAPHLAGLWITWVQMPDPWMPVMRTETKEDFVQRSNFWVGELFMYIIAGALFSQLSQTIILSLRIICARSAARIWGYELVSSALDKHVISNRYAIAWHILNNLVCVVPVIYALARGLLDPTQGLAFELIAVWVALTLFDFWLQTVIRASTCPEPAAELTRFVFMKILPEFVPLLSVRVDQFLDWTFVGICAQVASIPGSVLCVLGICVLVHSSWDIYKSEPLVNDLKDEFLPALAPPDLELLGIGKLFTDPRKFLVQQINKASQPYKLKLELTENIPQAALKLVFIVVFKQHWSGFILFTFVTSLVKPLALVALRLTASEQEGCTTQKQNLKGLNDAIADNRRKACAELGNVAGPADPEVVKALILTLKDESRHVRVEACNTLGKVAGPADPEVVKALILTLKDEEESVRHDEEESVMAKACRSLGKVASPGDQEAIKALEALLPKKNLISSGLSIFRLLSEEERLIRDTLKKLRT